jgi:dTDP-4-amino-4,6-dideoxygalactose transaminase
MKNIPFSPPRIDDRTVEAVRQVLLSGWITTGPKTRELEQRIADYTNSQAVLCLNSWTNAAELALRWFGIGAGDEVIIPAYTYAATANIVVHLGATPVMVDCEENNFLISIAGIRAALTPRTKAIMPVDIGGMPFDYDELMEWVKTKEVKNMFQPSHEHQRILGRPLVISDAAHSFGAIYKGRHVGAECDVCVFSFHAVKNFTTAEGGAVCLNMPEPFDNTTIWKDLNVSSLHGQTKDALSKAQAGQWRYDIVEAGYKCNMTDVHAAIGLAEWDRYDNDQLVRRKEIALRYHAHFESHAWYIAPPFQDDFRESCYHLFALRINGIEEQKRDELIQHLAGKGISTNVHFQPLPLFSFYKQKGYRIEDFPNAMKHYSHEISLPIYYTLKNEDVDYICTSIIHFMNKS